MDTPNLEAELLQRLTDLSRELDDDGVDAMLSAFVRAAPGDLDKMRAAAARGDAPGLREAAHALKGAASYIGAIRVRDLCRQIEQQALAGSTRVEADLDAVATEVTRLCARFALGWKSLR